MKHGWEIKKLGEVCEWINRGISPKYITGKGLMVLNQKCIRNHRINFDPARIHDNKLKSVDSARLVQIGDVLVNSTGTGTLGRVAQVKHAAKATVDSHITIVRPLKDTFFNDFFGYAMVNIEEKIATSGEGCGGQTELSRNKLKEDFFISYPTSVDEQKRIVAILDKTFAAIDKAKANTEKNLQNAMELFESYLNTVFVKITQSHNVKPFKEVCELVGGSQPSKNDFIYGAKEGYIRLIQVRDYRTEKYITYIPKTKAKRFCSETDIMIGRYGPPIFGIFKGLAGAYNVALMKAAVNEALCNRDYFFWFLNTNELRQFVEKSSKRAAGQDGVRKELLDEYPVPVPSIKEQRSIVREIDALRIESKKLEALYQQKLSNLAELKKSILQKAFTGELTSNHIRDLSHHES
jgi:type I restriction enzyme, S subunit